MSSLLFTEVIHDTPIAFRDNKPFTVTWTNIYIYWAKVVIFLMTWNVREKKTHFMQGFSIKTMPGNAKTLFLKKLTPQFKYFYIFSITLTHALFRCFTQLSYQWHENSAFVSLWKTKLELPYLGVWQIIQQLRFCVSFYLLNSPDQCKTLWLQALNRKGVQKDFWKRF